MSKDNIIYDNDDNAYGFYPDVYKFYAEQIKTELENKNIEQAQTLIEELEDVEKLSEYGGIIKLTNNNGMGFSATPYKGEE